MNDLPVLSADIKNAYLSAPIKEKYYIIDLLVADISLVVTKRSEFNSMLKKSNYNLQKFNEILNSQNKLSYNKLIE